MARPRHQSPEAEPPKHIAHAALGRQTIALGVSDQVTQQRHASANKQAWENYMSQLDEWRATLEAEFGEDLDETMTGEALYTVKKTVGSLGEYDNSFTTGAS